LYRALGVSEPDWWIYLLGGLVYQFILGLTVAARQGDRGHATPPVVEKRV
jgi:hypothetical protein